MPPSAVTTPNPRPAPHPHPHPLSTTPWPLNTRRPRRHHHQEASPPNTAEPDPSLAKATMEADIHGIVGDAAMRSLSSEVDETCKQPDSSEPAPAVPRAALAPPAPQVLVADGGAPAATVAVPAATAIARPSLVESKTFTAPFPSSSPAPAAPTSATTGTPSKTDDAAAAAAAAAGRSGSNGHGSRTQQPEQPDQKLQGLPEQSPSRRLSVSPIAHSETDIASPWNVALERAQDWIEDSGLPGMTFEYAQRRIQPISPSTFLRSGSKFVGTQKSERHQYDVQVEVKHVDLGRSFLCGFLRIQGLTDDHPTLTTFFEAEIIGRQRHGFLTRHDGWGASEKTDLQHWEAFPELRPYAQLALHGPPNTAAREATMLEALARNPYMVYMRWKEYFLVPNHRVHSITGASFEGFYYISFDRRCGGISGVYFHNKSEKFQKLELTHVEDRGCRASIEFR